MKLFNKQNTVDTKFIYQSFPFPNCSSVGCTITSVSVGNNVGTIYANPHISSEFADSWYASSSAIPNGHSPDNVETIAGGGNNCFNSSIDNVCPSSYLITGANHSFFYNKNNPSTNLSPLNTSELVVPMRNGNVIRTNGTSSSIYSLSSTGSLVTNPLGFTYILNGLLGVNFAAIGAAFIPNQFSTPPGSCFLMNDSINPATAGNNLIVPSLASTNYSTCLLGTGPLYLCVTTAANTSILSASGTTLSFVGSSTVGITNFTDPVRNSQWISLGGTQYMTGLGNIVNVGATGSVTSVSAYDNNKNGLFIGGNLSIQVVDHANKIFIDNFGRTYQLDNSGNLLWMRTFYPMGGQSALGGILMKISNSVFAIANCTQPVIVNVSDPKFPVAIENNNITGSSSLFMGHPNADGYAFRTSPNTVGSIGGLVHSFSVIRTVNGAASTSLIGSTTTGGLNYSLCITNTGSNSIALAPSTHPIYISS